MTKETSPQAMSPRTTTEPSATIRRTVRRGADREFLPAALEIIETPPSPIGLALLSAIVTLVAVALVWGWIGRIDMVAVAPGRIQPTGRVKVVQTVMSGSVVAIETTNGARVVAGAPLLRLDAREVQADATALGSAFASARAEVVRRRAALAVTERDGFALSPPQWDGDVPADVRAREEQSLGSEVGRFVTEWKALDAQRRQKVAETTRLTASVEAQKRLLTTHDIRVGMRTELVDRAAASKAQLLDAQEARQTQVVNLTSLEGQLTEARAAIDVIDAAKAQAVATFVAAQSQKLAEAERAVDELRERLEKARTRLEQTTVRAPTSGIVTALAIDGVGQVVGAGDELMRIVPEDLRLELEVHVSNSDIGFVHLGQAVAIKIDSFPYARFGSIAGTVRRIAHDSVADPDVRASLVSPTGSPRSRNPGGTRHAQNLVFPVIVELDRQSMTVDGLDLPLAPGMTAVADIKTGSRRILEYLLSPLVETGTRAFRER